MNYRPITYGLATAYIVTSLGCATVGRVGQVEERVSGLEARMPPVERKVDNLGTRVDNQERKPNAERTIMVKKGQGVDDLYGWLRGLVLPQYQNKDARQDAEDNCNAITLVPTGIPNIYYAVVMDDANNDGTASKGDFTCPDSSRIQFVVDGNKLPRDAKFQLLEVMGVKGK